MRKKYSKEKKHRSGDIPVGSFSDIAFLLIIYFLVATSLTKLKGITADLPSGEKAEQAESSKTPILNLRGEQMFFNDKPVQMEELKARLRALELAQAEGNGKVIMLESTPDTPYQSYYEAMATISEHGGVIAIVEEEK